MGKPTEELTLSIDVDPEWEDSYGTPPWSVRIRSKDQFFNYNVRRYFWDENIVDGEDKGSWREYMMGYNPFSVFIGSSRSTSDFPVTSFRIRAKNIVGWGDWSEWIPVDMNQFWTYNTSIPLSFNSGKPLPKGQQSKPGKVVVKGINYINDVEYKAIASIDFDMGIGALDRLQIQKNNDEKDENGKFILPFQYDWQTYSNEPARVAYCITNEFGDGPLSEITVPAGIPTPI